jgi:miniconductance mechanosensitive channel
MNSEIVSFMQQLGIAASYLPVIYWSVVTLVIVGVIYLSNVLCHGFIVPLVRKVTQKTQVEWDDTILNNNVMKTACALVPPVILIILLPIFFSDDNALNVISLKICNVYIAIVAVKLMCAVLTSLYILSSQHEKLKNRSLKGVFQMLKLVVICVGVIIIISELMDKDPVKIIAGFGASAAILMLVFKDTIMGLVAGVQLSINDMLRPGDWITIPKFGADGEVVEVTLTTVKVQNWDKTITTIPPYLLVSDSFQNWRGMWNYGGRRVKRSVFIDMQSIAFCDEELLAQLSADGRLEGLEMDGGSLVNLYVFRKYLENFLRNHPRVNSEMMIMVRQLQPTPQGLPLELYFFSDGTAWVPYENLQSEVFEHLFAVLPQFGLRVFQAPAGTDFSSVPVQPSVVEMPKRKSVRKKKQLPDNSNTLF